MNLLDKIPQQLAGRGHPDSVPVSCDCGNMMMWERRLGEIVTCTQCKATGAIVSPPQAAAVEAPTVALPQEPVRLEPTKERQALTDLLAIATFNQEAKMKDVIALPDTLNDMLASLQKDAAAATGRLATARGRHVTVVGKIHAVADLVESAVSKSEHILEQMTGGGNGAPLASGSTG